MDVSAEPVTSAGALVAAVLAVGERSVTEDEVRSFLEGPASVGIVGRADDAPSGYLIAYLVRRIDGHSMLIVYDLGVAPDERRRGVGRAMITEALAVARHAGCTKAWVITDHDNAAAVALYEATGAHHPATDDAVMWWEL